MRKYILFIAFLIFLSCSHKTQKVNHKPIIKIKIDPNTAQNIKCSQLFDTLKYIRLETRDDALIASIDKIEIVDSTIYLLDKKTSTIWIYSLDGRYLNQINRRGRGRGEYISCSDICINDNIKILDRSGQKIEIYDFNGVYKKTVHINQIPNSFFAYDDDQFWLFTKGNDMYTKNSSPKMAYNLFYLNKNKKNGFIPYEKYLDMLYIENAFNYCPEVDELLFHASWRDTIYLLEPNKVEYKYVIDFGKSRIPVELFKNKKLEILPHYASLIACIQSERYIFINYSHENRVKFYLINKETSNKINGRTLKNDLDGISLLLCKPDKIINDQLIFVRNAYEIVNQIKSPKNNIFKNKYLGFDSLKETDNPILIFAKLNKKI